jgi:preprotein translocase subunit YajC
VHAALINAVVLAATTSKSKGGSPLTLLIPVLLIVVAYFVLVRPARNRQRMAMAQEAEVRGQIAVGEEIITTSGLIGTIVARTDDEVTLEIAPGVHARYVPAAIMRLRADDLEPPEAPEVSPENDITNHEVIEPGSADSYSPGPDTAPSDPTQATDSSTEIPPENPDEPSAH